MTGCQRYKMNEPLTVPTLKVFTLRLEETSKQVLSNVTDGIEKARQASTRKKQQKQQPFVLGVERITGQPVSIHTDKLVHILPILPAIPAPS